MLCSKQSVVSCCKRSEEEEGEGWSDPGKGPLLSPRTAVNPGYWRLYPYKLWEVWPSSRVKFCLHASAALFLFSC